MAPNGDKLSQTHYSLLFIKDVFCFSLQLIIGDEWVTGEEASTFLMFFVEKV